MYYNKVFAAREGLRALSGWEAFTATATTSPVSPQGCSKKSLGVARKYLGFNMSGYPAVRQFSCRSRCLPPAPREPAMVGWLARGFLGKGCNMNTKITMVYFQKIKDGCWVTMKFNDRVAAARFETWVVPILSLPIHAELQRVVKSGIENWECSAV